MKDYIFDLQLFADDGAEGDTSPADIDDDNFFDDIDSAGPQADEEPAPETTPEPEIEPEPYKLKIKYNHEEMEIPEDEAIPLIQKGMNYDKLQERYDQIQNDPRLSRYDKIAQVSQLLGYQSEDHLIQALQQNYYQLMAQQQGLTPQQVQKEYELNQRQEQILREQETAQQQKQTTAMYERFLQAYPDVQTKDIRPETWERVKAGMDLTTAYGLQLNEDLKTQIAQLKQKDKNKQTAPVSGVTNHGNAEKVDPLFVGFDDD